MGLLGAFVGLGFVAGPALGGLLSGIGNAYGAVSVGIRAVADRSHACGGNVNETVMS